MSFAKFKKGQEEGRLEQAVAAMKEDKSGFKDERFWKLEGDASGCGEALIRFLPQPYEAKMDANGNHMTDEEGEEIYIEHPPITNFRQHSWKENGRWFIEKCLYTLGDDCPVCEHIRPLWDFPKDSPQKKEAMTKGGKKNYIANILVVNDKAHPENNGKVFLYRFGKKIFDKIMSKLAPESEFVSPEEIHNLYKGKNFALIMKQVDDNNNYDDSMFMESVSPVGKDDDAVEAIYNQMHLLSEFTDKEKFPTYDELKKKFDGFMGFSKKSDDESGTDSADDEFEEEFDDSAFEGVDEEPSKEEKTEKAITESEPVTDDGDDDFEF